jgi:hypothetical protein
MNNTDQLIAELETLRRDMIAIRCQTHDGGIAACAANAELRINELLKKGPRVSRIREYAENVVKSIDERCTDGEPSNSVLVKVILTDIPAPYRIKVHKIVQEHYGVIA